jgi:hypothetical protein
VQAGQHVSRAFTVVEIDHGGSARRPLRDRAALFSSGLDIHRSKIATRPTAPSTFLRARQGDMEKITDPDPGLAGSASSSAPRCPPALTAVPAGTHSLFN